MNLYKVMTDPAIDTDNLMLEEIWASNDETHLEVEILNRTNPNEDFVIVELTEDEQNDCSLGEFDNEEEVEVLISPLQALEQDIAKGRVPPFLIGIEASFPY
jgi:hypothetical protein